MIEKIETKNESIYKNLAFYGPFAHMPNMFAIVDDKASGYYLYNRIAGKMLQIDPGSGFENSFKNWGEIIRENRDLLKELSLGDQTINECEDRSSSITIFPTEKCNLLCQYCHCNSSHDGKHMKTATAIAAVDFLVKNSDRSAHLCFAGGGEPTRNMTLVKDINSYFMKQCQAKNILGTTAIITNGCMSSLNAEWIFENINSINLSYDGLPELQNIQRPFASGRPSWPRVRQFLKLADAKGRKVGVRVALSFDKIDQIPKIVTNARGLPISILSIEPVFKTGRAKTEDNFGDENYEDFFKEIDSGIINLSHCGSVKLSHLSQIIV